MVSITERDSFKQRLAALERAQPFEIEGRIAGLTGLTVEVDDFAVPVGAQCEIITRNGTVIAAEAIGFRSSVSVLMPLGEMSGIARGRARRAWLWPGGSKAAKETMPKTVAQASSL